MFAGVRLRLQCHPQRAGKTLPPLVARMSEARCGTASSVWRGPGYRSAHPGFFRKCVPVVIPRHQVSPPASPMTGSGGESSTPRRLGSDSGLWNTGSSGRAGRRRWRVGQPLCPSFGIAARRKIRLEQARNAVPATNRQWFWPRFERPKGLAMLIRSKKYGVRGGAAKAASMSAPVRPAATAPTLLLGGLLLLIGP
jgi:hypothetical protein